MMLDSFGAGMRAVPGLREAWARYERFAASPGVAQGDDREPLGPRRPARPAGDPRPDPRHRAHRRRRRSGRLSVAIIADTHRGSPVRRAARDRQPHVGRRPGGGRRGDRVVRHRRPVRPRRRIVGWRPSSSRTSSARRNVRRRSATEAWRELLARHDALVRSAIERGGGRVVKTTGDGVLATFDGPGRAIEAAGRSRPAPRASTCTSAPACMPARSRSPPTTSSDSPSTWPRASPPSPARTRSS